MRSFQFPKLREEWASTLLIVLVTLLTYAPFIGQLGFYRDDWYLIWMAEHQGWNGIIDLFRGDRPLFGWFYALDYLLLGSNPLGWHLLGLFVKLVSAFAFLWLLRSLWPQHKIETTVITLLYVVYPGFYQQPNVGTFMNHLMAYAGAILSLACTVQALKTNAPLGRIVYTFFGLLLAAFYIFTYEALIGIEAVRALLIGYFYYRQKAEHWKTAIRPTLSKLSPYLLLSAGFLFWRLFVFQAVRRATRVDILMGDYLSLPLYNAMRLTVETFKDVFESSILAWMVPYYQFTFSARYRDLGIAFGLTILVLVLLAGYSLVSQRRSEVDYESQHKPYLDWLVLGIMIVFVTTLPVVAAGRHVFFSIQWDKYTLQSSFGVALLAGGFVLHAIRGRLRWVALALLLFSGVVTQAFSAMYYRDFWEAQRAAWWQLSWRAPQIAEGTTVIASLPGIYQLAEEYEVWGPVNLLYHRGEPLKISGQVPYPEITLNLASRLQEERLVRGTVTVKRDYGQVLVVSMPDNASCLHVYNGALGLSLTESPTVAMMAPYSDTSWIQASADPPAVPTQIFGSEPQHDWCFYYQKMNLALQTGNWTEATRLAEEAISRDLRPAETAEWLPVLFAYANSGQEKRVKQTSKLIYDRNTRIYLCHQLSSVTDWPPGYMPELVINNLCVSQE
jgi:hypothetical protein